jgi:hypothetical protein
MKQIAAEVYYSVQSEIRDRGHLVQNHIVQTVQRDLENRITRLRELAWNPLN